MNRRELRRSQRGAVILELVILFPALIAIPLAMFAIATYWTAQQDLQVLAQQAASAGARPMPGWGADENAIGRPGGGPQSRAAMAWRAERVPSALRSHGSTCTKSAELSVRVLPADQSRRPTAVTVTLTCVVDLANVASKTVTETATVFIDLHRDSDDWNNL